jgi:hypothetical protein
MDPSRKNPISSDRISDDREADGRIVFEAEQATVVVLRADSPGKPAQWFAESIPES